MCGILPSKCRSVTYVLKIFQKIDLPTKISEYLPFKRFTSYERTCFTLAEERQLLVDLGWFPQHGLYTTTIHAHFDVRAQARVWLAIHPFGVDDRCPVGPFVLLGVLVPFQPHPNIRGIIKAG